MPVTLQGLPARHAAFSCGKMNFRTAIAITAALVTLLAGPRLEAHGASPDKLPDTGKNHALIIGIDRYENFKALQSPVRDASLLARILARRYNFKAADIVLLTDQTPQSPTLVNILTHMERLVNDLGAKDNLLIFFSGHSAEDDEGETYWIPVDGQKKSKLTWLNHASICEQLFASAKFTAKNLLIISDSPFANKLVRPGAVSLTPYDLRYSEKIVELSANASREVIAFGDQHWPPNAQTDGLGLFAYYLYKALEENPLEVVDFENLFFDESVLFPISKIAGTRMLRGRIKSPAEAGGQYVITRMAPLPPVEIAEATVNPPSGYPGDEFTIAVTTRRPADAVYLTVDGRNQRMEGSGVSWRHRLRADTVGEMAYRVEAANAQGVFGKAVEGNIRVVRQQAALVNVRAVQVDPPNGVEGDPFRFSAETDGPAASVVLRVNGRRLAMQGAGTRWRLVLPIETVGRLPFEASASNEDGIEGPPGRGTLRVDYGACNVEAFSAKPAQGFAGEEFTFSVRTDRAAERVVLTSGGRELAMQGEGREWRLKALIETVGEQHFTAVAQNPAGVKGRTQSVLVRTRKSPVPIADVVAVVARALDPDRAYAGQEFEVSAETGAPAREVILEMEGRRYRMEGRDTRWVSRLRIDTVGTTALNVFAKNAEDAQGRSMSTSVAVAKAPAAPANVEMVAVEPLKGPLQEDFTFTALTDRPARSVALLVGSRRYDMSGEDRRWALRVRLDTTGEIEVAAVARNADGIEGGRRQATVTVLPTRYRQNPDGSVTDQVDGGTRPRFVDHADGTVTDVVTGLMWLKKPKQIAVKWEEAVAYCRNLEFQGLSGWRLPTIQELRDLRDKRYQNPALPPQHPFAGIQTHIGFWSKSKHRFGPKYVYQMNLWFGKIGYQRKDEHGIVWPVRYAGLSAEE